MASARVADGRQEVRLRLYKRREAAPRAFAKLAGAQLFGDCFQVRNGVDEKLREFGVRRIDVERRLAQQPHSQRLAELEVVDAEKLQALLNLGEKAALQFDALRGDFKMNAPALGVVSQANDNAQHHEGENYIGNGSARVDGDPGRDQQHQEGQQLADAVYYGRMAGKQIFFGLGLFRG